MSTQPIKGFPLPDDYATTRVPNAVLGRVLSGINDVDTIKLILRTVWLLERQTGYPRFVAIEQLRADRVLSVVFGDSDIFDGVLARAVACGVLVRVSVNGLPQLMLNTESSLRVAREDSASKSLREADAGDGWDVPATASVPTDAFRAYEGNIGFLTPMIRESILAALEDFSDDEIIQAIKIAVENESRSWSFVAGVLKRWMKEGVPDVRRTRWHSRQTEQFEERKKRPVDATRRNFKRADQPRVSEAELEKFLEHRRSRTST